MPHRSALSFTSVIDLLLDAVCVVDVEGHFVFVSAACEAIFGYRPEEMVGRRMIDMVAPEDRERTLQAAQRVMAGQAHLHFENRYLRKDGQRVDIMWSAQWSPTEQYRVAVARDVTARKRAEQMQAATYAISEAAHASVDMVSLLERIHLALSALLPSRHFVVALADPHEPTGRLDFPYSVHSDAPGRVLPHAELSAICDSIIQGARHVPTAEGDDVVRQHQWHDEARQRWLGAALQSQSGVIGALVVSRTADDPVYVEADRELLQYVSIQVASAIERQRLMARLQRMAQYDELTGLPNRGCFQDRLKTAIARARREGHGLSLLYLDLDKFKAINDTWGHAMGDRLLQAFAQRLTECVRDSDTVARMSGDEFVVLLESRIQTDVNPVVVHKINAAFNAPFELDGQTLSIRPSIGIAHYPEHGQDEHALLRHADDAMYRVKHRRR